MLQKVKFAPGFNKQVTPTGGEGQWQGGDYVRFRYGTPEKIGGWDQLGEDKLTGAARALHHWDDNAGIKYAGIGTNRILYIYSGGIFYDIHPIKTTTTLTSAFSTTNGSAVVTLTFSNAHNIAAGEILLLDNFFATAIPNVEEIEVELCAAPKGSYSLSLLFVNPERPPPLRSVFILSLLPVKILCG